jgi:cobalt/nickel transport system permease protein
VSKSRPELFERTAERPALAGRVSIRPVLYALILAAVLTGGVLSWFASTNPEGIEWSIAGITGGRDLQSSGSRVHDLFSALQKKIAFLPDYNFRRDSSGKEEKDESAPAKDNAWPSPNAGTSLSGLLGGAMSLLLAGLVGFGIKMCKRTPRKREPTENDGQTGEKPGRDS